MRMTPASITFRDHEWVRIMDALVLNAALLEDEGNWVDAAPLRRIAREIEGRIAD
jgi:hypothetical protein